MRRLCSLAAAVVLILGASAMPASAASHAAINARVEDFISRHPGQWVAIDRFLADVTGQHITVSSAKARDMSPAAAEAERAAVKVALAEAALGDITIQSIPSSSPQVSIISRSGGGAQIWGSWDFPDTYNNQGAPSDAAGITMSMDNNCLTQVNPAIWTYKTAGGSTNLGSLKQSMPDLAILWNVADAVSGGVDLADRGTAKIDVVRTASCPGGTIGFDAAFDYEANKGPGSWSFGVVVLGFFTINYTASPETSHLGTTIKHWTNVAP
jgi:hypothetical protein